MTPPSTRCPKRRLLAAAIVPFAGAAGAGDDDDDDDDDRDSKGRTDLLDGAVFSMSNDPAGNTVVAFYRAEDGTLTPAGRFPTGGRGSSGFEDSANGLVLGSARGIARRTNPREFSPAVRNERGQ